MRQIQRLGRMKFTLSDILPKLFLVLIAAVAVHHYYIHGVLFDLQDLTALFSHEFLIVTLAFGAVILFLANRGKKL